MYSFQETQYQLASHLRDPDHVAPPQGVDDRRLRVYRDLIYKNIEGFISGGFPILRSIFDDEAWHAMVRDFIQTHQSHTPYFLEISQEFLKYLQEDRVFQENDPPFMLELAHYEWVELALDISTEEFPTEQLSGDLLNDKLVVSPLVWCLSYQYPVHRIGEHFQPTETPEQPTFLLVYRNRDDRVKFMESNAVTNRLVQLLQSEEMLTGRAVLETIAQELQAPDVEAIINMGTPLLHQLHQAGVICGAKSLAN